MRHVVIIDENDDCPRSEYRSGRLNLVIDPELKEWAHAYASRRHTTVTAILTEHLVRLRDGGEKSVHDEVLDAVTKALDTALNAFAEGK